MSTPHPHLPGVCSNNTYQPKKKIASGAYGAVFRASCVSQHPQAGQAAQAEVAIKFIPFRSKDRNPKYLEQIKREVSIVNQLTHPHVVRIHDYVVYAGLPNEDGTIGAIGLVMDLAKCSLQTYIFNCQNMDEASARWLFQQLMLAVDHCHGKGVTQRDIKPGNILLFPQKVNERFTLVLKLADFGWAKRFDISEGKTRAGTEVYAAPEVLQAFEHIDKEQRRYSAAKADVWSCGVVLFEMLFPAHFVAHRQGRPDAPWLVPPPTAGGRSEGCTQLLHAMLQPNPERRATVKDVLGHPWFQKDLPPGTVEMNAAALKERLYVEEEALQGWLDTTLERYK